MGRYSARSSVHQFIFGRTAGGSKVTDYPSEAHEGLKGGQLWTNKAKDDASETELSAFMEMEQEARARGKSLKELANAKGNEGHEAPDDQEASPVAEVEEEPAARPSSDSSSGLATPTMSVADTIDLANGRQLPPPPRKRAPSPPCDEGEPKQQKTETT